jgi:hypothetical protein
MIKNLDDAFNFFNERKCNGKARIFSAVDGDKGPFSYILTFDNRKYYLMFKKDWFYSFSKIYKGVKKGIGQSFNMKLLISATAMDAILVVIMEDERVYFVTAKNALKYVNEHNTKRIPKTENNEEGSIPATMLISGMIK